MSIQFSPSGQSDVSTIDYTIDGATGITQDSPQVASFQTNIGGYPIYMMPRSFFKNTIILSDQIYIDSDTMDVYLGDDETTGGILAQEYLNFSGIDGGQKSTTYTYGLKGI